MLDLLEPELKVRAKSTQGGCWHEDVDKEYLQPNQSTRLYTLPALIILMIALSLSPLSSLHSAVSHLSHCVDFLPCFYIDQTPLCLPPQPVMTSVYIRGINDICHVSHQSITSVTSPLLYTTVYIRLDILNTLQFHWFCVMLPFS